MKPEPIRILLVEDEEQLREMLLMTLEDEGYEVVGAPSGEQALQEALKNIHKEQNHTTLACCQSWKKEQRCGA